MTTTTITMMKMAHIGIAPTLEHNEHMNKLSSILGLLLISSPIQASYTESCEVSAIVTKAYKREQKWVLQIKAQSFKLGESSHGQTNCQKLIGANRSIELEAKSDITVNKPIKLRYHYSDGLAPNGLVVSERWEFLP